MNIRRLEIHGIRNIRHARLDLQPGTNLIYGRNGSGKTSILEAIHLLARGRSFRTRHLKSLVNKAGDECTCFGEIQSEYARPASQAGTFPMGVQRNTSGQFQFRIDGSPVTSASRLAQTLPVQLINAVSFELLEGSPSHRRSFLDWGVFHVEHSYQDLWSRFGKCLKHRNSLLRRDKMSQLELGVWDREFARLAEAITERRRHYIDQLIPVVREVVSELGLQGQYRFDFEPGWDQERDLQRILREGVDRDLRMGYTRYGPHRADIRVQVDGSPASQFLSRGQIKMLVISLKVAQGYLFRQLTGQQCVYLIDDLPAELDRTYRKVVLDLMQDLGAQVLITGVDEADLQDLANSVRPGEIPGMFHVEQGSVEKVLEHEGLG